MGRPEYWPVEENKLRSLSFDQGMELLQMFQKRVLVLKAQITAAGGEFEAPMHLLQLRDEVVEMLEWLKPVEDDERFGDQFIRIYRNWTSATVIIEHP